MLVGYEWEFQVSFVIGGWKLEWIKRSMQTVGVEQDWVSVLGMSFVSEIVGGSWRRQRRRHGGCLMVVVGGREARVRVICITFPT